MDANAAPSLADLLKRELGTNLVEVPPQNRISYQIAPCTASPSSAIPISEPFHLLICGHVVLVDDQDCRCGPNCQHASALTLRAGSTTVAPVLPPISTTQLQHSLYCEICNGIPFDRYIIMKPPSTPLLPNSNPSLRRCLALTRTLLQLYTRLPDEDVDELIAPLSFGQTVADTNAHTLLCQHEVFGDATRPCAVNCAGWTSCHGTTTGVEGVRGCGAFLCQECVARAGLVHLRYARSDAERAARMAADMAADGWGDEEEELS